MLLQAGAAAVSRWGLWSPAARERHVAVEAATMLRRNPPTRGHWIPEYYCLQVDRRNLNWTQNPRQKRHPPWAFLGAGHCPDSHWATGRFWKRPSSLASIDKRTHFYPIETNFRHTLYRSSLPTTLFTKQIPYPIAYVQAKCPLNIHATFSLSLAIDKCHTWAAGISVCQHRSTLLPDGTGSSIFDLGGCNCCYQPFTATVIPRVFWWKTVTTHFSNKPALFIHSS